MLTANQIRGIFLDFFKEKGHKIVASAPIVVKNDPTLMFTNAGMNQFKDYFLGNKLATEKRIADTQKCLRVSGKHNDLEEVGIDTYHHTMFEMLGNWSFGDYFKKEAIEWAWELLVDRYQLPKDRLYVTVFEGDAKENLESDEESREIWSRLITDSTHILNGNKKDNFWEMGETGPCGPCSEIHIDLRSEEDIAKIPGHQLVNEGHPEVIEIWNNVFMQFNRKADGSLESLPDKHVDTGMGFERLTRVIQQKTSNYDSDIFRPIIARTEELTGKVYGETETLDIAFRVIADHIRAVTFTIADGQLPASGGAGYVIRRILRRAIRYGNNFLGMDEPFIYQLVDVLADQFKGVFPEVSAQKDFLKKIIQEEENSFLRTLASGSKRFENYLTEHQGNVIPGQFAFELYDTFGFPYDLTALLAKERGLEVNYEEFESALAEQKKRSRADAQKVEGDWIVVQSLPENEINGFIGYDSLEAQVKILRYRKVEQKGKESYQLVLNTTPFYPEGGGQTGDAGILIGAYDIEIFDTKKENDLIIHFAKHIHEDDFETLRDNWFANVNVSKRIETEYNHSSTHLLHAALRQVLGIHVHQKGSLVNEEVLRFDFSHFSKMTEEELNQVEDIVNQKIREDIHLKEDRSIAFQEAIDNGAMALFGEKYGEKVRMITFDKHYSIELCGGTHVKSTGNIGYFKIISESAIAAGVRRIEAITGYKAHLYIREQSEQFKKIRELFKNPKDIIYSLEQIKEENKDYQSKIEGLLIEIAKNDSKDYLNQFIDLKGIPFLSAYIKNSNPDIIKAMVNELKLARPDALILIGGTSGVDNANVYLSIPTEINKTKGINAGAIIKEISPLINGGGGGQPTFATAGGKNPDGLNEALELAQKLITEKLA